VSGVLAVMRDLHDRANESYDFSKADQQESHEARATVEALIEAAESARSSLQQLVDIGRLPPNSKGLRDVNAALARAKGEQP
jgi:hypothetical protein